MTVGAVQVAALGALMDDGSAVAICALLVELLRSGPESTVDLHWHPVGFINAPLAPSANERLNLHIWHPELSREQEPPHTCHAHGWTLESVVLAGTLTDDRFTVTPRTDGTHALYQVSYDGSDSVSRRTDSIVAVSGSTIETFSRGTRYVVPPHEYHRTRLPESELAVTLIRNVAGPAGAGFNVRPTSHPQILTYKRRRLDYTTRSRIVSDTLTALDAALR